MSQMSCDRPPTAASVGELLGTDAKRVDAFLRDALATRRNTTAPPLLIDAMEYSLFAGGKRLRPTLLLAAFRACEHKRSHERSALAAAGAMELIHTFSLVHDDLPAMDDDDLRRGRPTNHKVFGEAMAILAGDAMTTLAFELIATESDSNLIAPLIRELATATGPAGMIGGQVLDIAGENVSLSLEKLSALHAMKTGALLIASCRLGAISARASDEQLEALTHFGRHLGLAFQIVDDVLDVTATAEQLGKQTNKDASHGKNTYPALLGLDAARAEADRQLQLAIAAIEPFGDSRGNTLRAIAEFVVQRNH